MGHKTKIFTRKQLRRRRLLLEAEKNIRRKKPKPHLQDLVAPRG